MGRVVLFKGQSQYDVLRIFIDQLGKGFKEQNKEVVIVDLLANDVLQQLQNAFQKPCDFVFAFNAMGIELQVNNRSLYDVMNVPFIASLVDDPVYHLSRLEQPVENMLITCVDRAHMNFINSYYGGQRTCVFLPHGGCKPIKSLKKLMNTKLEKLMSYLPVHIMIQTISVINGKINLAHWPNYWMILLSIFLTRTTLILPLLPMKYSLLNRSI